MPIVSSNEKERCSVPLLLLYCLFVPLLFVLSAIESQAIGFTAPVVSVLDDDTIEVLHNNCAERIRLRGIDCPEKGQTFGNNAEHAALALAFGKDVTVQTHGPAFLFREVIE